MLIATKFCPVEKVFATMVVVGTIVAAICFLANPF